MDLGGKVVIVTGASRGIGLEIARALVREGARVAFAARAVDAIDAEVRRAGAQAMAVAMDVTSDASVTSAVSAVHARFGRVDVVINNAGNGGALGFWAEGGPEDVRRMFDVHVFGAERVMRAVIPSMLARRSGTIVNVASTVAWVPMPSAAAYSAAKAAVVALSDALRAELAPRGVDVRLFVPPHTSTEAGLAWPLGLPKIFEPAWVAAALLGALRADRARFIPGGNHLLLLLQRLSPALAARVMHRIGFDAAAKARALASPEGPIEEVRRATDDGPRIGVEG